MGELETIDAGRALELLREAVRRHGRHTEGTAHGGIIAAALSGAGFDGSDLALFSQHDVRTLWVRSWLPCPMTLGAVAVLGRAQRAEQAGVTWRGALKHAARSAQLLAGPMPLRGCSSRAGEIR